MSTVTTGPKRSAWKTAPLRDLLQRVRKPVKVEADKEYQEIGIRSHGRGIFYKEKRTGASLGNKSVFWVEPNCFVVNIVFAWEQAIAKTTTAEQGMIASHRFPMYKPRDGILDLDFLVYYFNSPRGAYLLGLASPGGAGRNRTLGQEEFLNLSIPLPPFREQRRIAQILAVWKEAIALTEQLIATKREYKKALTQQLLTGQRRFREFGEQPWREIEFSELLDIEIGRTPSRKKLEYWDTDKTTENIWLSIADLNGKFVTDSSEHISDEGVKSSRSKPVPAGTVVMSFKLTIGRAAILARPAFTNEAICSLIPRDPKALLNRYLYHALSVVDFEKEIDPAVKGKTLNKAKLNRLKLRLPSSFEEQVKIADFFDLLDDEIRLFEDKLAALQRQKKGLMQQLLTGHLRIEACDQTP
jgi:type I restriction enzyme S subunit